MIRSLRFPIAGLMGLILIAAVGMAALRNANESWAGVVYLMTSGMLLLAIVGIGCRTGAKRTWWLGFGLFGWGYLSLAYWYWDFILTLPTTSLLEALGPIFGFPTRYFNNPRASRDGCCRFLQDRSLSLGSPGCLPRWVLGPRHLRRCDGSVDKSEF